MPTAFAVLPPWNMNSPAETTTSQLRTVPAACLAGFIELRLTEFVFIVVNSIILSAVLPGCVCFQVWHVIAKALTRYGTLVNNNPRQSSGYAIGSWRV